MGHDEPGLIDALAAVEQQVEVQYSRGVAEAAGTAGARLQRVQSGEQIGRRESGLQLGDRVHEVGLLPVSLRLGPVERRLLQQAYLRQGGKRRQSFAHARSRIVEV